MFGISFGEILLIGLIALLVLGPDRLPGAARTAGLWIGRLKRSFNSIKQDMERELGADEIRRQLHNENILSLERELKQGIDSLNPLAPVKPTESSPEVTASALDPQASVKPAEPQTEPTATDAAAHPVATANATETPQPPRAP
ncbi:Sec-independent protein translocase subunit TatB [Pseudomonas sp. ABC1]|uniref:Sec-independent protein translocase protein TatB n=1 Tax=Pseudomonas sp. ABC1 TaxID=2748080 RepID=UPI0015C2EFE7|nr:Sec-independent protein translocase protein TatB [Pseudomonas sp. ABC1]QLF93360.1 Sec-independent protein translocase subunit TatB [Pseudomonas sp. ABC1]